MHSANRMMGASHHSHSTHGSVQIQLLYGLQYQQEHSSPVQSRLIFKPQNNSQKFSQSEILRPNQRSSDSNTHQQINLRFKKKDSKYSGSDQEHLQDYTDAYATTAEDYGLSATQKLRYLHKLFRGDALRFYNAQIKGQVSTYREAKNAIIVRATLVRRLVSDESEGFYFYSTAVPPIKSKLL